MYGFVWREAHPPISILITENKIRISISGFDIQIQEESSGDFLFPHFNVTGWRPWELHCKRNIDVLLDIKLQMMTISWKIGSMMKSE